MDRAANDTKLTLIPVDCRRRYCQLLHLANGNVLVEGLTAVMVMIEAVRPKARPATISKDTTTAKNLLFAVNPYALLRKNA